MKTGQLGQSLRNRTLHEAIRPLRAVDSYRNLGYLAVDYATLAAILACTGIAIHACPNTWWGWLLAVAASLVTILLVGGVQHRLAGLGHEAAHFTFLPNRFWNDLIADLFCMFPLFANLTQYRLVHSAHHQFTNDWERDPDLMDIGISKGMHRFPMGRGQFIRAYFIRFLWPPTLLAYLWDVLSLSALGRGRYPYLENRGQRGSGWLLGAGLALLLGMAAGLAMINNSEFVEPIRGLALVAFPLTTWALATAVLWSLPDALFFRSPIKQTYSPRFLASLRLGYYVLLIAALAWGKALTGVNWGNYVILFWFVPLLTSFPYFMLLRDVYQHANADQGLLTNTRVFFADPFTRWAVFVYGQDLHLPHHLFPAVPHYNLLALHRLLQARNGEYAQHGTECHGTFHNDRGLPTILDVMETGTREPDSSPSKGIQEPLHRRSA